MQTVDILLPTYNGERYIKDQITSLLTQSHTDVRIFIRDDGSTDETGRILSELACEDQRIILIHDLKGNLGLVNNINLLMAFSTSKYLMYCDQDDVWLPEKIEVSLIEIMKAEKEFGEQMPILVHSDVYVTDQNLKVKKLFKGKAPLRYGLKNSLFKYYVQGATCMFNLSLKREIHPFIGGVYLHDRYTHLVAEILGRRIYIKQPLMYYRQHTSNLVGSSSLIQKIRNNFSLKKIDFYLKPDRLLIKELLEKKFVGNNLLTVYLEITAQETSKILKLKLLSENRIAIRFKDFIVLLLKKYK